MDNSPFDKIRRRVTPATRTRASGAQRAGRASGRTDRRRGEADPPFLARIVNQWWTRLLQSIYQGSLGEQEAEYEPHSTKRDYIWNTAGVAVWGMVFPFLTIVATQLVGTEEAGMFSLAFVVGTLLMIAAGYGVRNFQVSDIDEANSFASYQINRWITSIIALVAGILFCTMRGYDAYMTTISIGVYVYKMIDGVADVYEGRLQQADKLYLAGISQTVRSAAAVATFSLALLLTRNLAVASVIMAVAATATLILLTIPLALLETEKSRRWSIGEVGGLLKTCFPLFAALFFFNLIESMPKFIMEGMLPYDNQLYFNALYFPAQGILLTVGFVYKPQLLRLAGIWSNPRKRRRFDLIVLAVMAIILGITAACALIMGSVGIPAMGFMYGVDFERFRAHAFLMVAAGGITAAIDFLYAIITILRRQDDIVRAYLISSAASVAAPLILVALLGLMGAVLSYLLVMTLLLVLLVVEYMRIRRAIVRERDPFA
ncbi:MAG: lipopolysaccharide biosynthesis protein [Collinsella sp.]|nr:lipopolysaccharide biosynthesis protein [Collinsella sp.]